MSLTLLAYCAQSAGASSGRRKGDAMKLGKRHMSWVARDGRRQHRLQRLGLHTTRDAASRSEAGAGRDLAGIRTGRHRGAGASRRNRSGDGAGAAGCRRSFARPSGRAIRLQSLQEAPEVVMAPPSRHRHRADVEPDRSCIDSALGRQAAGGGERTDRPCRRPHRRARGSSRFSRGRWLSSSPTADVARVELQAADNGEGAR